MEWMLLPLKRYADFSGRSRRKEYWMFVLGMILVCFVIGLVAGILSVIVGKWISNLASGLFALAIIIPSLAVAVRRLHDTDKSGWFLLLGLIPLVGGIILLVFYCTDGTPGPNRFGADPKTSDGELGDVFS